MRLCCVPSGVELRHNGFEIEIDVRPISTMMALRSRVLASGTVQAHWVVRRRGSHILLGIRLRDGDEVVTIFNW
jgi:hypothetical protein